MAASDGLFSSSFSVLPQSPSSSSSSSSSSLLRRGSRISPPDCSPIRRNVWMECLARGNLQTERLVGRNFQTECLVGQNLGTECLVGRNVQIKCLGGWKNRTECLVGWNPRREYSVGWNLRTECLARQNLQIECLVGRNAPVECLVRRRHQTLPFVGWRISTELLPRQSLRPQNCTIPPRPLSGSSEAEHNLSLPPPPPRPKRIILVRHGQSEGNVDESVYCRVPDSKITLTEEGWHQALACGLRIRDIAESDGVDDWKVYFYVSPYKRTLQTLRGIGTAFKCNQIAGVREEPRIREQDFGNFQDREKMRLEKEARLRYGRFFYRFPNGESAADVYDRITGFRETLRADIDIGRFQRPEARSKNMNLVIVSHGLTLRVFLMRWYKWSVKQFEGLCNFENTGMLVMQLGSGGRYSLLVHHSPEELREFGLTTEMIEDQEWQMVAKVGELNYDWVTSGSSFFSHFNTDDFDLDELPSDIARNGSNSNYITLPPPCS